MGPADHFPHFNYTDEGPGILSPASPGPRGDAVGLGSATGPGVAGGWGGGVGGKGEGGPGRGGGGRRRIHRGWKRGNRARISGIAQAACGRCSVAGALGAGFEERARPDCEGGGLCSCVNPLTKGNAG